MLRYGINDLRLFFEGDTLLPAPVRLIRRGRAQLIVPDITEYLPDQKRHAILGILASHLRQP
ncbi:hypothetical protein ACTMU2_30180 [Cupriavidus basilensis]